MTLKSITLATAVLVLAALAHGGAARTSAELPYYADAGFRPNWGASPPLHRIGAFRLTTQTGAALTDDDLVGRVHIANFMFTRCNGICPAVMSHLKKVQAALQRTDARIVSFSVTPELDPPDLLAAFGERRGVDPARWLLVTGDRDQIYRLARESYFADDSRVTDGQSILHSEKVLLVDRDGRLRGVYNGTQLFDMERLIEDVKLLGF